MLINPFKLYSSYIFRKTLVGFTACISVLIALIWFSRALSFVKYVTENGVAIDRFLYLFILILPWLLLFIVPISLLAAILIVYNRLITSNEISILKNAGLTKISLIKPAAYLSIICTLFCFSIALFFMPYANKELRLSRNDLRNNYTNLSINSQTFESLKSMTMYVKDRDANNQLSGILLHDERNPSYSSTITSETGHIVAEANSALLYMEQGTVQKFNYDTKKSEILHFDNYVFNLTEGDENEDKLRWKSKERYLSELMNPEAEATEEDLARFRTEIHQRFTYPLLPIIFSIIALSCIMRGSFNRRGNNSNIVLAIFLSTFFLILTITIYSMMETSPKATILLYSNFILFFSAGLYSLREGQQNIAKSNTKK